MIIEGNLLIASDGFLLRKIYNQEIVGRRHLCGFVYYSDMGEQIIPPHLETYEDFEEVSESHIYGSLVNDYIRKRYSESDELAIQRQRDTKSEQFQEYFNFCEECKKRAREELRM